MRTTVTLDDVVEERLKLYAAKRSIRFKHALNDVLREGLRHLERAAGRKPYRSEPKAVGLKSGLSYDNVSELLEQVEGAAFR
jgi:hypothetical protein